MRTITKDGIAHLNLQFLKLVAEARGYRFQIDPDGTERMIRPDGTVAIIARKNPHAEIIDNAVKP